MLKKGEQAPNKILVKSSSGSETSLAAYLGQPLLVYFYPKDDTPGCTLEAKQFTQLHSQLKELGVKVIGVSKDGVKSHQKFKNKYKIPFELLSDEEHKLIEAFGVWQEKRMFGSSFMGTVRATFAIDESGKIIQVWPRVKPKGHAQEVLEFFKEWLEQN